MAGYCISESSFPRNHPFLNLDIVENLNSCQKFQFFIYLLNWNFAAETIQVRKLSRKYSTIQNYLFTSHAAAHDTRDHPVGGSPRPQDGQSDGYHTWGNKNSSEIISPRQIEINCPAKQT